MKLFEEYYNRVCEYVLSHGDYRMFSDIGGFDINRMPDNERRYWLSIAEYNAEEKYPQILASDFIRFHRDGDRADYERLYFKRRDMLFAFAVAEAIEGRGRYLDRIMDGIWLICDEADWVIPAHIYPSANPLTVWCKYDHPYMDLFSAETGAVLALTDYLVGDKLDEISPLIRERLRFMIHERITRVYIEQNDPWWMGFKHDRKLNNWTPWITSNVLTAVSLCETDISVRRSIVSRALVILDRFADGYGASGGCDEGPVYWDHAGGSFFDALELIYDMTDGKIDVFGHPLVKNIGEYVANFHIDGNSYVNFADASAFAKQDSALIYRYGRRVHSNMLCSFGEYCHKNNQPVDITSAVSHYGRVFNRYRSLKNGFEDFQCGIPYVKKAQVWYDDIGVMIERSEGMFLAFKGGHNGESHNHNDIGNFILYADEKPVVIDAGVGKYTKKTFSAYRYTIWAMRSEYHNTPIINGFGQEHGKKYAAKDYSYRKAEHSLSIDIADAYLADAGVVSYVREALLTGDTVAIRDKVTLSRDGDIELVLMLINEPMILDGFVDLGEIILEYSENLTPTLDTSFDMCAEDDSIKAKWDGAAMYRLVLKSKKLTEGELGMRFRRKSVR